jgi:DNA-binding transcriptional LysR family regulator
MEIQQVRHFIAAAEGVSMTQAAERLGIAQPALSQSLKRLEDKLGVRLFNRSRRGITLNPVGQAILEDLRAGVALLDAAAARAQQISQGLAGTLTVGFVASAIYEVLPHAVRQFRVESPDVRVMLREMGNIDQVQALERGEIDLGLAFTPVQSGSRLRQQVLTHNHLIAAVHDGFAVEADGTVSLATLAREGLITFDPGQVPLMRAGILAAMVKLNQQYQVVQEVGRSLTAIACVAARVGVSLLPSPTRRVAFEGVRYCEIRERDLLPILELSAIWPARSRSTLIDRFVRVLGTTAGATVRDRRPA